MNMTEQEMEEALASQMAYQAHLEGMMRDDGWTVNDYEKNQNIAAINPDGKEYAWTHWEHLDAYLLWKIHKLGYTDCTMHKKNYLDEDQMMLLVRSPSSKRLFSYHDFAPIVIDGKEPPVEESTPMGVQLTELFPNPEITDFYVDFSVKKGGYVEVEKFTCS